MTLAARLWRPSAIVTIGTQIVRDINLPPPAPRGPRIAFRIKRTLTSTPDAADIAIWNLAPERETNMALKYQTTGTALVTIAAGYGAVTSTLFRGDTRTMRSHVIDGADWRFEVSADDGGDALSDLTVSYYTAGWTVQNMIDVAIKRLALGDPLHGIDPYPVTPHSSVMKAIDNVQPGVLARMYTGAHAGKVSDLLDEAARILGVRWWIANNVLYMAARRAPVDGMQVVLDRRTWLDLPQECGEGLVKLSAMFNPDLIPGRFVQVVGRVLPGVPEPFRCDAVEISGDTRSGPWRSDMILRRVVTL